MKNKIYELLRGFNTSQATTSAVPPNSGDLIIGHLKRHRKTKIFAKMGIIILDTALIKSFISNAMASLIAIKADLVEFTKDSLQFSRQSIATYNYRVVK